MKKWLGTLFIILVISGGILFFSWDIFAPSSKETPERSFASVGSRSEESKPTPSMPKLSKDSTALIPAQRIAVRKHEPFYSKEGDEPLKLEPISIESDQFEGGKYKFVPDFVALKATDENRERFPEGKDYLGFWIVPSSLNITGLDMVYNEDTKRVGILTGVLKVTFKSNNGSDLFESRHVFKSYPHLKKVFYRFDGIEESSEALKAATSSPNVKRAQLEILEFHRSAR